jgi:hypothetical protein
MIKKINKKYQFQTLEEFVSYNIGFETGYVRACEHISNLIQI